MILILSDINDQHADRVEIILQNNSAEYSRLNLDVESIKSTLVRYEDNSFRIDAPNCSFSTSQIDTVWNSSKQIARLFEYSCPPGENLLVWKENWNKTLEGLFSTLESTKWLNFYQDFYNENQFSHFTISKNIGLKWPCYICSNDINYLNSFFESKKERVLELMDQNCPERTEQECRGKCEDKVSTSFLVGSSGNNCPVAHPAYQVRCSVVGKEYFAGKLKSKTNGEGPIIGTNQTCSTLIQPPKTIQIKAIQIMTELNLTYGVFDFIVAENGEWFFEALNPIGTYQWIEDIKGTDISSSIAKWLMMNN
jgi:hypothetical protein